MAVIESTASEVHGVSCWEGQAHLYPYPLNPHQIEMDDVYRVPADSAPDEPRTPYSAVCWPPAPRRDCCRR